MQPQPMDGKHALLSAAYTHSSFANERPGTAHNETLEWLGDSVLQFLVSFHLYKTHPTANEAELTRRRAAMVCNKNLAAVLPSKDVSRIRTSQGTEINEKVKAGVLEAVVGALWQVDQTSARDFIKSTLLEGAPGVALVDPVSELQQLLQSMRKPLPQYKYTAVPSVGFVADVDVWWGAFSGTPCRGKAEARKVAAQAALDARSCIHMWT